MNNAQLEVVNHIQLKSESDRKIERGTHCRKTHKPSNNVKLKDLSKQLPLPNIINKQHENWENLWYHKEIKEHHYRRPKYFVIAQPSQE